MPQSDWLAGDHALGEAIVHNDPADFETLISARPELVETPCRWVDRRGRERPVKPLVLADMLAWVEMTKRLLQAGADIHDLDALAARLEADDQLVRTRFALDYGNHLALRGSTLLHVAVEASIQFTPGDNDLVMDCIHKGKDHGFDEVLKLTPRGYAERFAAGPVWREASRELAIPTELGAP